MRLWNLNSNITLSFLTKWVLCYVKQQNFELADKRDKLLARQLISIQAKLTIHKIKTKTGIITTYPKENNKCFRQFYQDLYTSKAIKVCRRKEKCKQLTILHCYLSLVDRILLHTFCLMEVKGSSQRWKMHLSESEHSTRFPGPTTEDNERGKTERTRDRGGAHNSVTMAPSFSSLTDRHYVVRRPLFSQKQHGSILKKTQPQKVRRLEREWVLRVNIKFFFFIAAGFL